MPLLTDLATLPARDPAGFLMVLLVLGLGGVALRFSQRFLQGDRDRRRATRLLALATLAGSVTWLASDLRLLLAAWALALAALVGLVGLARDWAAARAAARLTALALGGAWLALAAALLPLALAQGHWQLPAAWPSALPPRLADPLAALLLLAVLLPAAQWPLQRWLLSSLVAPTPVSAIMHAGFVNAGGLLLLKFGWLPALTAWALPLLLLAATVSVLVGAGMARVQVDVKRQLAASTVAQMGLMLLQCALGAPAAALIHLLLHGCFKASLFLQAGSALQSPAAPPAPLPAGRVLATGAGLGALLLVSAGRLPGAADVLSTLLLGLATAHALLGLGRHLGNRQGWPWLLLAAITFLLAQAGLRALLAPLLPVAAAPAWPWLLASAALLAAGAALLHWLPRHPGHPVAQRAWLWLVAASEPAPASLDPHPLHLARRGQECRP